MNSIAKHNETGKKLIINRLPIPTDMMNLIKDYLFYEERTSPMIQHIQDVKNEICELFTNHTTIDYTFYVNKVDWRFDIDIIPSHPGALDDLDYWPLTKSYEFGARICKICGNYKATLQPHGRTIHNKCKCT